jgi:hypothetical protein
MSRLFEVERSVVITVVTKEFLGIEDVLQLLLARSLVLFKLVFDVGCLFHSTLFPGPHVCSQA